MPDGRRDMPVEPDFDALTVPKPEPDANGQWRTA